MTTGIKTINSRLIRLESSLPIQEEETDNQLLRLVSVFKKKETDKKKEHMAKILKHFEDDFATLFEKFEPDDLTELIIFAIRYVEANGSTLSTSLGVKFSSEFKQSLATSLINHIYDKFDDNFLIKSIDSVVKILFPKIPFYNEKKGLFRSKKNSDTSVKLN